MSELDTVDGALSGVAYAPALAPPPADPHRSRSAGWLAWGGLGLLMIGEQRSRVLEHVAGEHRDSPLVRPDDPALPELRTPATLAALAGSQPAPPRR